MKRFALVVVLLAVVAGLGFLAWQFFESDAPEHVSDRSTGTTESTAGPAATAAVDATPALRAERTETERPALPTALPPTDATTPESYRRALAGIHGRLVEEDGKPVAGVKLELLELLGSGLLGNFEQAFLAAPPGVPQLTVASGVSDAKGIFELRGAIGGAFHGLGIDLGGARGTLRFVDRTLPAGAVTDLGDIVLSPFVTWKGTVVDEEGAPVPGARIRATLFPPLVFQPGVADVGRVAAIMQVRTWGDQAVETFELPASMRAWEAKLPFPTAISRDDGTFELAGVPQGLATLVVDRAGFAGAFKGPVPTGKRDRDVGRIELGRGRTLAGTVVDAFGKPVANAEVVGGVVIDVAHFAIAFPAAAPTDGDGRFAIEHLSEQGGDLRAAARARAGDPWVTAAGDGSGPVTITLPTGLQVDVTLTRAGGGVVADAELSLRHADGPPFLTWAPPLHLPPERIERIADGKVRLVGVVPGRYDLLGRAAGLALTHAKFEVAAGSPAAVTLEFTAARELAIAVIDRDTKLPIEHVEISAGLDERMTPPLATRRTDALGNATLKDLPARSVRVRAFHPAYAPTTQLVALEQLPDGAPPLGLVLGPGAALHGRVHHGSQPITEPMLFILTQRGDGANDGVSIDDEMPRFAIPGADGTFTLRGLEPERSRWELMPRLFSGEPQEAMQKVMEARRTMSSKRGQVELKEGETTELDIDADPANAGKPGRISGIVRVKDGSATFRVRVHQQAEELPPDQRQKTVEARANQRFSIEPVRPGFVGITIERTIEPGPNGEDHGSPALHQEWFELMDGEDHALDVAFEFTAVEARILDPAGQPVAGTNVEFGWRSPTGNDSVSFQNVYAMTDADGIARTELPKPGPCTVKCLDPRRGRGSAETIAPSREPVTVTLALGVPCAGRVEITPDPGADAEFWLSLVERRSDGGQENFGWQSLEKLEKGNREFEIVGVSPGQYTAQLYGNNRMSQCNFVLGENGDDRLVLRFTLQ